MQVARVEQVRKSYREGKGSIEVLKGIDFALDRGEIVALEGPSGSGKTTMLSILGCILAPSSGRLEIEGEEIDPVRMDRLAAVRRKSIGFVFQQFNLFPALSAVENIEFALNVKGATGPAARVEAERVLDAVGLSDHADYLPRDLSGGQKQRVAVARALAGDPALILADEPTANLDSQTGAQVLELFRDLARRENRTLLVVTHDPKVRTIADRVLQIDDGRLVV